MKEAAVAIEDQRFYEHRGIDYQGIGRAVFQDILPAGAAQGGSTITQQFVKNALRAQGSRTVFEKLREAALAYQLERHWDKDKILTEYLNEIYFGEGAYGIEAAAQDLLRLEPPGLRRAREPLRLAAPPLGGGDARRHDLEPERLRPQGRPRRPRPRDETWCSRRWPSRATSTQEEAEQYSREQPPAAVADQDPGGGLEGSLLHLLAAPAARRQVRRRRGVRRRARRQLDPRPLAPGGGAADRLRAAPPGSA